MLPLLDEVAQSEIPVKEKTATMSTDYDPEVLGETSGDAHNSKGKGKKRTRSFLRLQASAGQVSKKSKAKSSAPKAIQAKHALNHHFYTQEPMPTWSLRPKELLLRRKMIIKP